MCVESPAAVRVRFLTVAQAAVRLRLTDEVSSDELSPDVVSLPSPGGEGGAAAPDEVFSLIGSTTRFP